jgi:hypothetical protein
LHRIVSASVRDMLDAYRIQAQAGPVTDRALKEIIFRATHVLSRASRRTPAHSGWRLPSVVRVLLTTFLEEVAGPTGDN